MNKGVRYTRLKTVGDGPAVASSGARGRPKLTDGDKHMTVDEVQRLLATAKDAVAHERTRGRRCRTRKAERDYLLLVTALNAGLRASELADLRVEDLRLEDQPPRVLVRGGKGRKAGSRGRASADVDEVALTFDVAELLAAWTRARGEHEPVFPSERRDSAGQRLPLTRGGVWSAVKKLLRRAGLNENYNVHALRHRFVMAEIEAQERRGEAIDPYLVARRARHRSVEPTMQYVHHRRSRLLQHLEDRGSEV